MVEAVPDDRLRTAGDVDHGAAGNQPHDQLDPFRNGLADLIDVRLGRSPVQTIVSISWNPASFARGAYILADGGYQLERVMLVAPFVWSTQVKAVDCFRRD